MDRENVLYIHAKEYYSVMKKKQNYVVCRRTDISGSHHVE
jgi:hypothetical protein